MTRFKKLLVPALSGKFGQWQYFQMILKVSDLVDNQGSSEKPDFRIKAVEEVEEIYSKTGVSELLQRAYDPQRLAPIKNYILKQSDKYINNLTVGVYGGSPNWHDIEISDINTEDETTIQSLKSKIGFIQLDGTETMFVLDGQHRLKGLRAAFETKPEKIKDDEVVCTLIVHVPDAAGRIRTRRLFSTINRHAKPVSKGENILLDEDDVSAIIVRKLIERYNKFKGKSVVALGKSGNITKGSFDKLTTVVTLYEINEKLVQHKMVYPAVDKNEVRVRPADSEIETQIKRVFSYWNKFLELFPSVSKFIDLSPNDRLGCRVGGGEFVLRPISQIAIFEILATFESLEDPLLERLKKLPLNLDSDFWHYVLWNPHKNSMLFNRSLARNYVKYNLGYKVKVHELKSLRNGYTKNSGDLELHLKKPLFK